VAKHGASTDFGPSPFVAARHNPSGAKPLRSGTTAFAKTLELKRQLTKAARNAPSTERKEQRGSEIDLIHELVDLKLIHLAKSRVTVSDRPGRIYEAYMLDLSQYAGARKRRKLQLVEFWKPSSKDALRKISLVYAPDEHGST